MCQKRNQIIFRREKTEKRRLPLSWSYWSKWWYRTAYCVSESWAALPTEYCWRKKSPKKTAWIEPRSEKVCYRLYLRMSCWLWGQETKVSPKKILTLKTLDLVIDVPLESIKNHLSLTYNTSHQKNPFFFFFVEGKKIYTTAIKYTHP